MFNLHDLPLESGASSRNGRRGARVSCRLWVRVLGWDDAPVSRAGDLAATGVFISTSDPWGSPNDVVMLELESPDRAAKLRTMARVARVLRQDDRSFGARVVGIGLEFLPLETIQPAARLLVRHAVEQELTHHGYVRLDNPAPAYVTETVDGTCHSAKVQDLGLEQVTLLTPHRIQYGRQVTLQVTHSDGSLELSGHVVVSRPVSKGLEFATIVHLDGALEERSATLLDLAQQVILPEDYSPPPASAFDFSGELGPVSIDEVLTLVSHRCYSGVLSVGNEAQFFSVQISEGSVTAVESNVADTVDECLARLRFMASGEFRFRSKRKPQLLLAPNSTNKLVADILSHA
jgi:Tfp pilus assembly protein PilZ